MESSGATRELVAGKKDATGAASSSSPSPSSTNVSTSISATAAASAKEAQAKSSPSSKSIVHPAGKGQATVSGILKGCEVFINPALDIEQMDRYRKLVREHGGGVQYYFEVSKTTHVITADLAHFADLPAAREAGILLVTPLWLENSVTFGEREDEEFYSPDPRKFFSGLCICSSQIAAEERDMMFAGVVAFGGRVSARLNNRCTHLIINKPAAGAKYEWARKHGGIKIVMPKWYNNSLMFRRREKETEHLVPAEQAIKNLPAAATATVSRQEQAKKEAEGNKRGGERKPAADKMERDDNEGEAAEAEAKGDQDGMEMMSQSEVSHSAKWTKPREDREDEGSEENANESKDEFSLMLDHLPRNKRARDEDDEGDEEDKKQAKVRKTTVEKKSDGEGEDKGEEEEEGKGDGEAEEEDLEAEAEEWQEGATTTTTEGKVPTRPEDMEEEIKTYIRKNAHRVSAREIRLKFKMGHPRAKRLLNEVIQEMKKELKKHAKKRQSSKDDEKASTSADTKVESGKQEKEALKKKTVTTPSKAATVAVKEDVGPKVPKDQLMKGMCVLLVDLPTSRYRDAMEAVREMGGTTHRGLADACKIEGVQWSKAAATNITHVLYLQSKPAIDALRKKMALHGLADVQEVSIEWIQWCDVHVRLFPPAISPLFQPLPHNPVPGMDELIISQSNTRGWEREEIVALISKMGAKYNRSMPNEPNVILVIATADAGAAKSEKVVMAKEWGVPIVTKEWLYDCARKWRRIDPAAEGYVVSLEGLEEGGKEAASKPESATSAEGKNMDKDKKKSKNEDEKEKKGGKSGSIKERREGAGEEELEEDEEHDDRKGDDKDEYEEKSRGSGSKKAASRTVSTTKRCIQCGATKTPCWRKGADGERSLCNACGLKFSAELRRRSNKHDTRKRKHDGGALDDLDDDDDIDDLRARASKRRSLTASGGGTAMDDGDEDSLDTVQRRVRRMMASQDAKGRYHFAFSCLSKPVTAQLKRIVTKLGGTYSELWEPGVTTHLVLGTLRRTEKMLCACASGSWVLQPSYLMKSDKKGRFLREEEHEWYDEEWDDEQEKRIWAACMRRHRLNLLETGKRAFEGWEFHLVGDTEPTPDIMAKIIESGGGKLISTRSLVKIKKHKAHRYGLVGANAEKKAVRRLTEVGLPCVDSIYLATFLCDRHAPAVEDFYI